MSKKNGYLSEFQTNIENYFWKKTFPMSNSNFETGFRTRRGVLALRNGLIFSIRCREGTFPDCVLNLLSKIRTKYWKKNSERQPSRSQTPIMRPDFELERGYLLYKSGLSFFIWRQERHLSGLFFPCQDFFPSLDMDLLKDAPLFFSSF